VSCKFDACNAEGIPNLHERATGDAVLQANKNVSIRQVSYHGDEMDSLPETKKGNLG
jgi:hypothetical protein